MKLQGFKDEIIRVSRQNPLLLKYSTAKVTELG